MKPSLVKNEIKPAFSLLRLKSKIIIRNEYLPYFNKKEIETKVTNLVFDFDFYDFRNDARDSLSVGMLEVKQNHDTPKIFRFFQYSVTKRIILLNLIS